MADAAVAGGAGGSNGGGGGGDDPNRGRPNWIPPSPPRRKNNNRRPRRRRRNNRGGTNATEEEKADPDLAKAYAAFADFDRRFQGTMDEHGQRLGVVESGFSDLKTDVAELQRRQTNDAANLNQGLRYLQANHDDLRRNQKLDRENQRYGHNLLFRAVDGANGAAAANFRLIVGMAIILVALGLASYFMRG